MGNGQLAICFSCSDNSDDQPIGPDHLKAGSIFFVLKAQNPPARDLHAHGHSSIIDNKQEMEAT